MSNTEDTNHEKARAILANLTPTASKKNTLFDAVIATMAKQLKADAIFSFDGWYRKIGLTLVSDFIKQLPISQTIVQPHV